MSPRSPLKTGHKGLYLIAEVDSLSERAMAAIGFRFTNIWLSRLPTGWLMVGVDWAAADEHQHKVRYGVHSSSGYGWHHGDLEAATIELEFPQVAAPYHSEGHSPFEVCRYAEQHKACLNVGLAIKQRRDTFAELPYELVYHKQHKWCAYLYYAPRGYDRGDIKPLFSWRERRRAAS